MSRSIVISITCLAGQPPQHRPLVIGIGPWPPPSTSAKLLDIRLDQASKLITPHTTGTHPHDLLTDLDH